jgi:hypothetical protein
VALLYGVTQSDILGPSKLRINSSSYDEYLFGCEPCGEKNRVLTRTQGVSVLRQVPVPASQSRTVLSSDADVTSVLWPGMQTGLQIIQ